MEVALAQLAKAETPNDVTVGGITMALIVEPSKAFAPMVFSPLFIVTDVSRLQPAKAKSDISMTEFGRV